MTTTTERDQQSRGQAPPAGTIVVGIDGSDSSMRALAWAADQAAGQRRGLTLAHAVLPQESVWIDQSTPAARNFPRYSTGTELALDQARAVVERRAGTAEVYECVRVGDPREVLLDLAEEAAELVVGSRGRGPLRSLLLGSVGVAVVRHAPCPVVVHRPGAHGQEHQGVVVGVDGSPRSRTVLEFAFGQASYLRVPLTVLHCVWDAQAAAVGPAMLAGGSAAAVFVGQAEDSLEDARLAVSEAVAGLCEDHPDVPVRTELARGLAADALVRLSDRADLLVVGSHHGGLAASILLGSVSTDVVEHAHCPVAVVPIA